MSPEVVGFVGIGLMLVLFAIGMPIAFAMAVAGLAGYAYLVEPECGLQFAAERYI